MTDPILGDFDFCFEVGPALLGQMATTAVTGNVQLPVQLGGAQGSIKVTTVSAQAATDRTLGTVIEITIGFTCGQFQNNTRISSHYTARIPVSLDLNSLSGLTQCTIHPEKATVPTVTGVTDATTLLLLSAVQAQTLATLQAKRPMPVGPAFSIVMGNDGALSLNGPVQLSSVTLVTGSCPDGTALVILGCVTKAAATIANAGKKTASALSSGQEIAAITSASLVQFLVKPPLLSELATTFGTIPSKLPGPLGSGGPVDITAQLQKKDSSISSGSLTSLGFSQGNGGFTLSGQITLTRDLLPVQVNFSVVATPGITTVFGLPVISITVTTPKPQAVIEPGLNAWTGLGIFLGSLLIAFPIGTIVTVIVGAVVIVALDTADNNASNQFQHSLSDIIKAAMGGTTTAQAMLPWPLTPTAISVTPTHIALGLNAAVSDYPAAPSPTPSASFNVVTAVTGNPQEVSSGTYNSTTCPVGAFPYTEYNQPATATVTIRSTMLCLPLSNLQWTMAGQTLVADNMPHTLQASVSSQYVLPLPAGHNQARTISVPYQLSNDGSTLTVGPSNPQDGNYALSLKTTLTDSDGVAATAQGVVPLNNDSVDIGGGFNQAYKICVLFSQLAMEKLKQEANAVQIGATPGLNINPTAGPDTTYVSDPESLANLLTSSALPGAGAFAQQVRMTTSLSNLPVATVGAGVVVKTGQRIG